MTALAPSVFARWRPVFSGAVALKTLTSALILVLIGVELAVLASFLPDTLEQWWTVSSTGDFGNFYNDAKNLDINGLYSPGLSVIMYPLTWLSMHDAYRVYVGLNGIAILAVAYLIQRNAGSLEARLALALGVISIPQLHWSLRLGHFTGLIALVSLGGFLLLRKRPFLAGLCFALLVLKPQYAAIPGLYLLWTRNGRAVAGMAAGVLLIEVVGFAAVGYSAIGPYLVSFIDLGADARDNLLPYQQSWQYAWQGFLISAKITPNPLLAIDLSLLCLGVVFLAWARGTRTAAITAAALGMLIVTPYANFYDWGLLVVAGALLLQADLRWKALVPVILVALYFGLLVTQQATPFPAIDVQVGVINPDGSMSVLPANFITPTHGIYWITPMALGVVALLAFAGSKRGQSTDSEPAVASTEGSVAVAKGPRSRLQPAVSWLGLALLLVPMAFFISAFYSGAPPFTREYDPFSRSEVQKKVPDDFPLPAGAKLVDAGKGEANLLHLEWASDASVDEIAVLYEELLAGPDWELMLEDDPDPAYRIRLAKFTSFGFMTHWAMLDVSEREDGTSISLELFVTQLITVTSVADLASQ